MPDPFDKNVTLWVKATSKKEDVAYFEGKVKVGGSFETFTSEQRQKADMRIYSHAYSESTETVGDLLQEVTFHSSCSKEMYQNDIYGSNKLVFYESYCEVGGQDNDKVCIPNPNGIRPVKSFETPLVNFEWLTFTVSSSDGAGIDFDFAEINFMNTQSRETMIQSWDLVTKLEQHLSVAM